jgi:hypothetical protein
VRVATHHSASNGGRPVPDPPFGRIGTLNFLFDLGLGLIGPVIIVLPIAVAVAHGRVIGTDVSTPHDCGTRADMFGQKAIFV